MTSPASQADGPSPSANPLATLYEDSATDLRYAVGVEVLPDGTHLPVVQVYYAGWDRAMLAVVCTALAGGVHLSRRTAPNGAVVLRFSTVEHLALRLTRAEQTFVLNAPAWDAELTGIAPAVAAAFEADCHTVGQYHLVLCTPVWSCNVTVHVPSSRTNVGALEPNRDTPPPA